MKKIFVLAVILSSMPILATSRVGFEEGNDDDVQTKMVKERIQAQEEQPSSTAIGGARSGELEDESRQDQMDHGTYQENQLYEHEGFYRKGL